MYLVEPPATPYDLRFRVAGIPVRIHPLFWLISLLLGSNLREPPLVLMWVGVVFVSILIHELGHALSAQAFGWNSHITLYSMGGLASYRPTRHDRRAQILITAAGPCAGFLLAACVAIILFATNHEIDLFGIEIGRGEPILNENLFQLVWMLLFVNIFWGLINCLPVFPLDGGQISREILSAINPQNGLLWALQLSLLVSALAAIACLLYLEDYFLALFFGYFAYTSYTAMNQLQGSNRGGW